MVCSNGRIEESLMKGLPASVQAGLKETNKAQYSTPKLAAVQSCYLHLAWTYREQGMVTGTPEW